jgi:membrane protease YdiL (CAAX protease family)
VRARTRTIYLPMVLHFIHNFVVLLVFYGVEL